MKLQPKLILTVSLIFSTYASFAADACGTNCNGRESFLNLAKIYNSLPNELPVSMIGTYKHVIQSGLLKADWRSQHGDYETFANEQGLGRKDFITFRLGNSSFITDQLSMVVTWQNKFGKDFVNRPLENDDNNRLCWTDTLTYTLQCRQLNTEKVICRHTYESDHGNTTAVHYSGFRRVSIDESTQCTSRRCTSSSPETEDSFETDFGKDGF